MTTHSESYEYRALLDAVLASPADDLPQLILADWLEENGEGERAEYIRVRCEIAKLEKTGSDADPSARVDLINRTWSCPALPRLMRLRQRERELSEVCLKWADNQPRASAIRMAAASAGFET